MSAPDPAEDPALPSPGWLADRDEYIAELAAFAVSQWGLTPPLEPLSDRRFSACFRADLDGTAVVLKIFARRGAARPQAAALRLAGPATGPGVLAEDSRRGLILMELMPGETPEADEVPHASVAATLGRFTSEAPPNAGLVGLPRLLEGVIAGLTAASDWSPPGARAPLVSALDEIKARAGGDGLVHGDVARPNMLVDGDNLFLLDPIGCCGNPAYDWGAWALHAGGSRLIAERVQALAALGPHSADELGYWAAVRARYLGAIADARDDDRDRVHMARAVETLAAAGWTL